MKVVLSFPRAESLRSRSLVYLAALLFLSPLAQAGDHFLTIGGGSSPSNNQVSLEKNVLYFQRFLADRGMGDLPHEILFSDGNGGARDLQYVDPNARAPRANHLLAQIFHRELDLDTQYRPHSIPHLWGPSGREGINHWFDAIGTKLLAGDRLFIYFTGHGGHGRFGHNTTLAMWNEPDMPVNEFVKLLDRLPPRVSVVLVMVQCYGGAFADVIFNNADASKGLTARNRCGFFATSADRVAAGCTQDVNEENYREYSTYFWAALYGRTRTGEAVEPPDFDHDGRVCLAEAHAYALIHSDTVDLSMKTSDAFLRQFSQMKTTAGPTTLMAADTGYQTLLDHADPPERAVLEGLSDRLELSGATRTQSARLACEGIAQRRQMLAQEARRLRQAYDRSTAALQGLVKTHWPELTNMFNPAAAKLLIDQGDSIARGIEAAPAYPEMHRQRQRLDAIDEEDGQLERKWIKAQRFIRTAEHVALEANLSSVASPDVQADFARLRDAENGVLTPVDR